MTSAEAEGGGDGPSAPVADPLSLLLQQRRNPVSPASAKGPPTPAGANAQPPFQGRSQPTSPLAHLFDVESSLGKEVSARHLDAQASGEEWTVSTHGRLECALAPGSNVDFPTITEISEALLERPSDVPGTVEILCRALGLRSLPRRRLKALTILNELVYDTNVSAHVKRAPGAMVILQQLQGTRGSGLGAEADGQIRMFATEIERICFQEPQPRIAGAAAAASSAGAAKQLAGLEPQPRVLPPRSAGAALPASGNRLAGLEPQAETQSGGTTAADVFRDASKDEQPLAAAPRGAPPEATEWD